MALIMYFNRAPHYDGITAKDIKLVESYYAWKKERALGGTYSCNTLEEWCGIPESEMPHKYAVNYLLDFMSPKTMYVEGIGEQERDGIFEQMGRVAKANHIFQWFVTNVMGGKADTEYYEVTREHCRQLLTACIDVENGFVFDGEEYKVNADLAKKILPIMDDAGYFFGADAYNHWYAVKVLETAKIITHILNTTDFEKQTIYFNAIWG